MTNVAPNMNISGLDSKRNKRPKVRFDEDVLLGIGEQEDIDFAVKKAKVSLFAEDIFNEEKKQEDIDCAVEKAKNSFFEEVILKEEKKRKSKKKKKKKKKSKHKDRDSLSDRADDAAGQDFFFHQSEFNVENHIPSSNLRESKGDLNLENNNGPVQILQQRYSAEIPSKISQLRLKVKMMEKDRESLRARNLGNEAQEIIDAETFEESPNIKETHTLLTTGNDAELKTSGENNEPIPSLPLGLTGKAESSQESLNEKHESDTVRMLSISERKCTSDYSSNEEKYTTKSKANELKKPPPTSFQLERDNSQRLGLSAAEIIDASRDSGQDKDETKTGAVQVASPAPRVKPDERVGAFNYSPLYTENSSPYLCDGMADEKVRVAASLESYEANADAGGLTTKINTRVLSFGSSSDSAATISPGAFAVARGGLSTKKNANVSFGPSVDSAAENYESVPQLSLAYASPKDVVKLQNSKALAGFSSLGHISPEDDKVPTITAFEVNEDDIENVTKRESVIRQQIISESVEAVEVVNDTKARRKKRCLVIFFLLSVAGIVLGLSLGLTGDEKYVIVTTAPSMMPSSSPTETILPTLEHVVLQGKLRCGVYGDSTGFSKINNKTGVREGIDADLCRAVAAAVFDDPGRVEFVQMRSSWRFPSLANRSIDLLAAIATHTMERDVNEKSTQTGFTFTVPYLYDGLGFGGDPKWVDCADRLDYHHMNGCRGLRICVYPTSSHEFKLRSDLFPGHVIVSHNDVLENFNNGVCNVVAGETTFLANVEKNLKREANFTGEYVIGNNRFSKEPLALVTRQDDPLWSGFVNHVLQALMAAERENITQSSADSFYNTTLFGDEYESMFINAIKAVGNFAELHDRNLKGVIPRDGLNLLNIKGDTGLIYSFPFGDMLVKGAGPTKGGTLEKILSRKHMICGISKRTGFGEYNPASQTWNGLDADFCRALAAGIFVDYSDSNVVFKELNETSDRFNMLADDEVDVMAGGSHTHMLSTDILEPTRGEVFIFSTPYFYESVSRQANETEDTISMNAEDSPNFKAFSLVTREDDPQWSDFVNWVVESTFYAEENGIRQVFYINMPLRVLLFGPEFEHMMQSAIKAVGNYGEIYARNIEKVHPRSNTRNMLNSVPFGPQISPLI